MTEVKHTPGPWAPGCMVYKDHPCQCRSIVAECWPGSIATISKDNGLQVGDGGNGSPPEEEAIANAHLIAAAPDMEKALEEAEEFIDRHSEDWYRSGQELLAKARAALAKARGEEK